MHKSLYAAIAVFKRIKLQYCVEPKQRQVQEHITSHPVVLCPVAHDKRRDLKVFQSMQILSLCWGERTLHNLSSFSTRQMLVLTSSNSHRPLSPLQTHCFVTLCTWGLLTAQHKGIGEKENENALQEQCPFIQRD